MCLVFGDKLVDPDITGGRRAGGSNRVSELVSDEVRTAMMMAIPGVPGEDYPILSSEVTPYSNVLRFYCQFIFQILGVAISSVKLSIFLQRKRIWR